MRPPHRRQLELRTSITPPSSRGEPVPMHHRPEAHSGMTGPSVTFGPSASGRSCSVARLGSTHHSSAFWLPSWRRRRAPEAAPLVLDPGTAAVFATTRAGGAPPRGAGKPVQGQGQRRIGLLRHAEWSNRHTITTSSSRLVHEPARHVVRTTIDGELRDLTLLAIDAVNDLAILGGGSLTPQAVLAPAPLSSRQGDLVPALGHPRDLGLSVVEGTHNGAVQHAAVPGSTTPVRSIPA